MNKPDPGATSELQAKLGMLSRRYAEELPRRVDEVVALFLQVKEDPSDLDRRLRLRRLVHALKGSGATFGFPRVSEAATRIENELDAWADSRHPDTAGLERVEALLEPLLASARTGTAGSTEPAS